MNTTETAPNRLINETSPYLLQHANNPVDWFPWCEEAFEKARREDKPIFLSIGYSTCHWCHVMAHESFEDSEVANILNDNFISIKVDKEERPDIDSIYMSVCQAFTRSGGWPTSIFMTPEQKPFFAGTYFPKQSRRGMFGFVDLLLNVSEQWNNNNSKLVSSSNEVIRILRSQTNSTNTSSKVTEDLVEEAINQFKDSFDKMYGGFGSAPKFPTPHNLLFLLNYYELNNDKEVLQIVEKTLLQMYKGGIFDHIGFGFSRYSTDRYWLVPHFEKMLYDNALLTMVYLKSYEITKNDLYKNIAVKTMEYVLRELTHDDGGFFSAQDADSDGVEGKHYVFTSDEIINVLGRKDGKHFNEYYNITQNGNFEGQNIPNLIKNNKFESSIEKLLPTIYEYRKTRYQLHKDDKILTSWNSLMIAAFANAYKILGDIKYLEIAEKAFNFIDNNLSDGNKLFTSYRNGKRTNNGFLDDYSFYIFSLIQMYEATFDKKHLTRAVELNEKVLSSFYDSENGGFYLYGDDSEQLVLKPKETYDGAIPSGNSVMAYNLVKLALYTKSADLESKAQKQLEFMVAHSTDYPAGHSFYMLTTLMSLYPPKEIVCVLKDKSNYSNIVNQLPKNAIITIIEGATDEYPLKNNKTTFYICEHGKCLPPTNEL